VDFHGYTISQNAAINGTYVFEDTTAGAGNLTGSGTLAGTITVNGTATLNLSGTTTITAAIIVGSGGFLIKQTGTGTSVSTGSITVNSGGVFNLATTGMASMTFTGGTANGVTINSGGTMTFGKAGASATGYPALTAQGSAATPFSVQGGTFTLVQGEFAEYGTNGAWAFSFGAGSTITMFGQQVYVAGDYTAPSTGAMTTAATSTFAGTQTVGTIPLSAVLGNTIGTMPASSVLASVTGGSLNIVGSNNALHTGTPYFGVTGSLIDGNYYGPSSIGGVTTATSYGVGNGSTGTLNMSLYGLLTNYSDPVYTNVATGTSYKYAGTTYNGNYPTTAATQAGDASTISALALNQTGGNTPFTLGASGGTLSTGVVYSAGSIAGTASQYSSDVTTVAGQMAYTLTPACGGGLVLTNSGTLSVAGSNIRAGQTVGTVAGTCPAPGPLGGPRPAKKEPKPEAWQGHRRVTVTVEEDEP
jgi:fibronectin-binding autotransporter adhesin